MVSGATTNKTTARPASKARLYKNFPMRPPICDERSSLNERRCKGHTILMFLFWVGCGTDVVQLQQAGKDFVSGEIGGPAVGGEDGGVEFSVGEVEPGGAQVVEVGEGALF